MSLTALPVSAGIGLRAPHYREVRERQAQGLPPVAAWWEVHSENFFAEGGATASFLQVVAQGSAGGTGSVGGVGGVGRWPVSLHGVSASLGGVDTLFERHLDRLSRLVERIEPAAVSEHLCWSSVGSAHFNDLLPLPYTQAALDHVLERIDRMQSRLKRTILVENVSSYLQWQGADFSEWDFLAEVAGRSGCGILLDVNNIYVSAINHGFDPLRFLDALPADRIGEIHLAGYEICGEGQESFLVDTHGARVFSPVWDLYEAALQRFGPQPTLIEWDTDIPALSVLCDEAAQAQQRIDRARQQRVISPPEMADAGAC